MTFKRILIRGLVQFYRKNRNNPAIWYKALQWFCERYTRLERK